jgi:hypothetical protein
MRTISSSVVAVAALALSACQEAAPADLTWESPAVAVTVRYKGQFNVDFNRESGITLQGGGGVTRIVPSDGSLSITATDAGAGTIRVTEPNRTVNGNFGPSSTVAKGFPLAVVDGLEVQWSVAATDSGTPAFMLSGMTATKAKDVGDFYEKQLQAKGLTVTRQASPDLAQVIIVGDGINQAGVVAIETPKGTTVFINTKGLK